MSDNYFKEQYKDILVKIKNLERYIHGAYTPFTFDLYDTKVNYIKKSKLTYFLDTMDEYLQLAHESEDLDYNNNHSDFYKSFIKVAIFLTHDYFYAYLHRYDCILDFAKSIKRTNGESPLELIVRGFEEEGSVISPIIKRSLKKIYELYDDCYGIHTERMIEKALYSYLEEKGYNFNYNYYMVNGFSLDDLDTLIPDMDVVFENDYNNKEKLDIFDTIQEFEIMKREEDFVPEGDDIEYFYIDNQSNDDLEDCREIDGSLYYV